jgi:hypothetical protein
MRSAKSRRWAAKVPVGSETRRCDSAHWFEAGGAAATANSPTCPPVSGVKPYQARFVFDR